MSKNYFTVHGEKFIGTYYLTNSESSNVFKKEKKLIARWRYQQTKEKGDLGYSTLRDPSCRESNSFLLNSINASHK